MDKTIKSKQRNRTKCLIFIICIFFLLLSGSVVSGETIDPSAKKSAASTQKQTKSDFQKLIGRWVRSDGGYVIEIKKIHADGKADAAYYNPRSINISKANVSIIDGALGLFIKLDDQGYPGSTYALKYNSEYDAMVGIYYQATMKQTYDVIFQRK